MTTLNEELLIRIAADVSDLKSGMAQAKDQVKSVGDAGTAAGKKVDAANKTMLQSAQAVRRSYMSIVGLFSLVAAAVTAAALPFLKWQDEMNELGANVGATGQKFTDLKATIMGVAQQTGSVGSDIAKNVKEGLGDLGGDVGRSLAVTSATIKEKMLGTMTEDQARAALAPIVRAYHVAADDIQGAMAVIHETQQSGVDVGQATQGLVDLSRDAKKAGLSFTDLATGITNLVKGGQSTEEAVGTIGGVLSAAVRPTQEMKVAGQDLFGVWEEGTLAGGKFGTVINGLRDAAARNPEALTNFLGGNQRLVESLTAIAPAGESFGTTMRTMTDAVVNYAKKINDADSALKDAERAAAALQNRLAQPMDPNGWFAKFLSVGGRDSMMDVSLNSRPGGGMAAGGTVGGTGNTDTVPAMLTPGEFVIKKKVADQMRPFLNQLNAGNTDLMSLWNTALSNTLVKGTHLKLLDALGIQHPQRGLAGTSFNAAYGASGERVSGLASSILNKFQSIQLSRGGSVPTQRLAAGGSVASTGPRIQRSTTIEGGVTINVQGRSFSSSWVRRQLAPELERIADRKQSRRKRTGR